MADVSSFCIGLLGLHKLLKKSLITDKSSNNKVLIANSYYNLENKEVLALTMDKPLKPEDFTAMEEQLKDCVEEDRKYWRVNDVKCDAIYSAKTYEEFADRVAAAHLCPLDRKDLKNQTTRGWNQFAAKQKDSD